MEIKRVLLLFFTILISVKSAIGQTENEKIKVILLGSFHYGATGDRNKISFVDLFSPKRQSELDTIASKLAKMGVNKFFLEVPIKRKGKIDSLYSKYKDKKLTDTVVLREEGIQIAYRTAVLNNAKLVATDCPQGLPYAELEAYEAAHKNDTINPYPFFEVKYPFTKKQKKLSELTLSEYYIQMNNAYNRQAIMFDYIHYALSYGVDSSYVGEALTVSWHDRNLKIFTNILRNIDLKNDKIVVVLYGAAHTAMLRHYFEDHPYFKIVELEDVFK